MAKYLLRIIKKKFRSVLFVKCRLSWILEVEDQSGGRALIRGIDSFLAGAATALCFFAMSLKGTVCIKLRVCVSSESASFSLQGR